MTLKIYKYTEIMRICKEVIRKGITKNEQQNNQNEATSETK